MNRFKSIIMSCRGKSKTFLHWLYNTHSDDDDEDEKVFDYRDLRFWFSGTGFRNTEKLIMYIGIPKEYFESIKESENWNTTVPTENYILYVLFPIISELQKEYRNDNKDAREKAQFCIQEPDGCMDKKSGCLYSAESGKYVLQMHFNVPLVNATSVNSKAAFRAVKDILDHIIEAVTNPEAEELVRWKRTYVNQRSIRRYMKENHLCAFVADGSLLPRQDGTEKPMIGAKLFESPASMRVSITTDIGETITGMGVREGITIITGGGYSGKTTLLDSIELGIYNHIPGDGREYVLSETSALKTNAEDGRPVENVDLAPFFRWLNGEVLPNHFCTRHASGSVSQAANIIEAIEGRSKLILIDEDKSATNFMIRDKLMRKIVPNEPIIPFTDRIEELKNDRGVSIVMVIGGSSEYLAYADTVILMSEFSPIDISDDIRSLSIGRNTEQKKVDWHSSRVLKPKETSQPFLYFHSVITENEKKIILDDYCADITSLTALTTPERLNTVMCVMEKMLTDKEADSEQLLSKLIDHTNRTIGLEGVGEEFHIYGSERRFLSEIRPLDAWCCINRMRGVQFMD